jgi:small subunit ribosomal protein S4
MNEKQKARFVYAISEKKLANYVKEAIAQKGGNATNLIFGFLEGRLDNVMYRLGYSPTRLGARQMVSHGHIMVNGRRNSVPSTQVRVGDIISIRPESLAKPLFAGLDERIKNVTVPSWIKSDVTKKTAEIQGKPVLVSTENMFDLNTVIEFYSR